MLLTINYCSIMRPLNEMLMFLDLQVMTPAQIALLNSTYCWILKSKSSSKCLIYNALCLTSQLKITFIHVFSFISLTLLWERRQVLLLFLRWGKCIFWETDWLTKVPQLLISRPRLDLECSDSSPGFGTHGCHPAEGLSSYSTAQCRCLFSSSLELSHCPVYSENSEIICQHVHLHTQIIIQYK